MAAIATNKDSVIIFEEPESYASTHYTQHVVDKLAADESNQYFISSHNPQFLVCLLSKLPHDDVKIYYATYENYETKVRALIQEDYDFILSKDMDMLSQLEEKLVQRI